MDRWPEARTSGRFLMRCIGPPSFFDDFLTFSSRPLIGYGNAQRFSISRSTTEGSESRPLLRARAVSRQEARYEEACEDAAILSNVETKTVRARVLYSLGILP